MSATMTMTMSSSQPPMTPPRTTKKPIFPIPTTATPPPTTEMTTTMTTTTAAAEAAAATATTCCPSCGTTLPLPLHSESHAALLRAQQQIQDLQAQVRLLNEKAAAAVDRWADYEDELSRLRAASVNSSSGYSSNGTANTGTTAASAATTTNTNTTSTSSPRSSFLPGRLSQVLLSPRRSLANLTGGGGLYSNSNSNSNNNNNSSQPSHPGPLPPPPQPQFQPSPSQLLQQQQQQTTSSTNATTAKETKDLLTALSKEKALRRAAEGKLSDTSREVEELSAALFEQANAMVASERRARAALEERVGVLERRDAEKADRLGRLEGAVGRIERVRLLLEEGKGVGE